MMKIKVVYYESRKREVKIATRVREEGSVIFFEKDRRKFRGIFY
jgi:hypothetical protein